MLFRKAYTDFEKNSYDKELGQGYKFFDEY